MWFNRKLTEEKGGNLEGDGPIGGRRGAIEMGMVEGP